MLNQRRIVLLSVMLASVAVYAQKPDFSFSLHQPRSRTSTLWLAPDGSLLVMSADATSPSDNNNKWEIRRIQGWDTSHPQEKALTIVAGYDKLPPRHELVNLSGDQVFMGPDGHFLVVRISRYAWAWNQFRHEQKARGPSKANPPGPPEAIFDVVDLRSFTAAAHREVTDPVLAAGDIGFNAQSTLVASGLAAHSGSTTGDVYADTGRYAIKTIQLPDLQTQTACEYTRVVRQLPVMTRYDPAEERRRQPILSADRERRRKETEAADTACGARLSSLGYYSVDDLENQLNETKQEFRLAKLAAKQAQHSWLGCRIESLSADRKYILEDCNQSTVEVTLGPSKYYRARRVYSVGDGKLILELHLAHKASFSGVIASSGGNDYMVLLRDGHSIEEYRLP